MDNKGKLFRIFRGVNSEFRYNLSFRRVQTNFEPRLKLKCRFLLSRRVYSGHYPPPRRGEILKMKKSRVESRNKSPQNKEKYRRGGGILLAGHNIHIYLCSLLLPKCLHEFTLCVFFNKLKIDLHTRQSQYCYIDIYTLIYILQIEILKSIAINTLCNVHAFINGRECHQI